MILLLATSISALGCLLLGAYALKFNPSSSTNRYFAAFSFVTALWLVFYALSLVYLADIRLIRVTMLLATYQSATLFLFASHFVELQVRSILYKVYFALAFIVSVLAASPAVFSHTELVQGVPIPIANAGMIFFATFALSSIVGSLILLVRNLWKANRVDRVRTIYILIGFSLTMIIIIITNFFGVILLQTIRLASIGMVGTLFFISFSAFAMTRYRFLDVRAVMKRSLLYGLMLSFVSFLYAILVALPCIYFATEWSEYEALAYTFFCAMFYTLLIQFSSKRLKRYFNGRFIHSEVDLVRFINEENTELNSTHELQSFILRIVAEMQDAIKAPVTHFFVLQQNHSRYTSFFPTKQKSVIHFDEFSTDVIAHIKEAVMIGDLDEQKSPAFKKILKKYKTKVYVPVLVGDTLYAFALIGRHKNNAEFNQDGLDKLVPIQKKAASGIPDLLRWQQTVENLRQHLKSQM